MSGSVARRLGQALAIRSGTRQKVIEQSIKQYVRETAQNPITPISGSFDASQVVSGTFAATRIPTLDAAAKLDGTALGNYANDAAAAAGGVAVGGFYRNGSVVMVRVT